MRILKFNLSPDLFTRSSESVLLGIDSSTAGEVICFSDDDEIEDVFETGAGEEEEVVIISYNCFLC